MGKTNKTQGSPAQSGMGAKPNRYKPRQPLPTTQPPQPARPQPAKPEPARPQPTRPQPAKPEPARPQPARPVSPHAGQLSPIRPKPEFASEYDALPDPPRDIPTENNKSATATRNQCRSTLAGTEEVVYVPGAEATWSTLFGKTYKSKLESREAVVRSGDAIFRYLTALFTQYCAMENANGIDADEKNGLSRVTLRFFGYKSGFRYQISAALCQSLKAYTLFKDLWDGAEPASNIYSNFVHESACFFGGKHPKDSQHKCAALDAAHWGNFNVKALWEEGGANPLERYNNFRETGHKLEIWKLIEAHPIIWYVILFSHACFANDERLGVVLDEYFGALEQGELPAELEYLTNPLWMMRTDMVWMRRRITKSSGGELFNTDKIDSKAYVERVEGDQQKKVKYGKELNLRLSELRKALDERIKAMHSMLAALGSMIQLSCAPSRCKPKGKALAWVTFVYLVALRNTVLDMEDALPRLALLPDAGEFSERCLEAEAREKELRSLETAHVDDDMSRFEVTPTVEDGADDMARFEVTPGADGGVDDMARFEQGSEDELPQSSDDSDDSGLR